MKTIALLALLQLATASAAEPKSQGGTPRSKSIDFEDSVVEGMNKQPLDSLEHVVKRDGEEREHLYQKRAEFRNEMSDTAREGGYTP